MVRGVGDRTTATATVHVRKRKKEKRRRQEEVGAGFEAERARAAGRHTTDGVGMWQPRGGHALPRRPSVHASGREKESARAWAGPRVRLRGTRGER
jgi:hypothetical protein